MNPVILLICYAAAVLLTFFIIRHFMSRWDLHIGDAIGLAVLWPFFLLMFVCWSFGDLFDRLMNLFVRRR